MSRRVLLALVAVVCILSPVLVACGATATPTAVPTVAPTKAGPTAVPPTTAPTKAPATAVPPTPTAGPVVGGSFVFATATEPDTLDPHKTGFAISDTINNLYGGGLVYMDKDGKLVPYLAEKWTISTDGLTYTFTIKKGIKFHNGNPCNAKTFVYTYKRALDPATKATASASMLGPVSKVEAPDDYTLVVTLKAPNFWMMTTLASGGYLMPLDQAAVEKGGDQYGRSPIGVGPYKFKEWKTGGSIALERNPDFNWGPPNLHAGPWYINSYEFRIIPDYSTQVAGLEAGELDYVVIDTKDLERLKASPKIQIANLYQNGMRPGLWYNVAKAPFNDVKVRQAFNSAIDQQTIIKTVFSGNGIEQRGLLSLAVIGYSAETEKAGWKFDLAKGKQLMKDAGYVAGADGMLSKDGQPLKFTMISLPVDPYGKVAQILQQQFKALGADVTIQQIEQGVMIPQMMKGDYNASVLGISYTTADLLYMVLSSANVGAGLNLSQFKDPAIDALLEKTRTETDPAKQAAIETEIQKVRRRQRHLWPPVHADELCRAVFEGQGPCGIPGRRLDVRRLLDPEIDGSAYRTTRKGVERDLHPFWLSASRRLVSPRRSPRRGHACASPSAPGRRAPTRVHRPPGASRRG